jgi:hypothetical protein
MVGPPFDFAVFAQGYQNPDVNSWFLVGQAMRQIVHDLAQLHE